MPNLMQNGAEWLGAQLKTAAGRTVTFIDEAGKAANSGTYPTATGWCGEQEYDALSEEGFGSRLRVYDWQFVTADVPSGVRLRAGLVLRETLNGGVRDYEAMPIEDRPAIEELDQTGLITTIHTKRVA